MTAGREGMTPRGPSLAGPTYRDPKDCCCANHPGPHWLHEDRLWKERNARYIDMMRDRSLPIDRRQLAHHAYIEQEIQRLDRKAYEMRLRGYGLDETTGEGAAQPTERRRV